MRPRRGAIDPATERDIVRAVEAARPIGDLLGWLIAEYPDADREWVFSALKATYMGSFAIDPASQRTMIYIIGRKQLRACPQRLA